MLAAPVLCSVLTLCQAQPTAQPDAASLLPVRGAAQSRGLLDVGRRFANGVDLPSPHSTTSGVLVQDFEMPASLRHYIRRDGTLGTRELRGWYRRTENNGWRPMSEAALADSEDAGRYVYGSRRTPLFHFDPAVRREDRVRKHKARRREWMVAMYRCGTLCARRACCACTCAQVSVPTAHSLQTQAP